MTSGNRAPGLITVEGVDGAGKSTHLALIEKLLAETDRDVVVTREPGGTPFGENIRKMLLEKDHYEINSDAEVLAVFAARAQHIAEVIKPAIAAGKWVLCDRFTEATYAYQGAGRGVGFERIEQLERWTQGEFRPSLTLLFLIDPQTAHQRVLNSGRGLDRFESEQAEFFQCVNEGYLDLSRRFPDRMRIIGGDASPQEVADKVSTELREWMG